MFFGVEELQERIVHIEQYLEGKTTHMWPECTQGPWEEKWLRQYLTILREEYCKQKELTI